MRESPGISVVVPVFGCASCLDALYRRLKTTLEGLAIPYELVFVDDRSRDGGWDTLCDLANRDHLVRVVRLSRNFGQHAAITAGLADSRGHWAVVMDCDLQDPPEEIPRLYQTAQLGYDVVLGRRRQKKHSGFRRIGAAVFFWFLKWSGSAHLLGEYGSLSIVSRKVINAFLELQDRDRHYLFILHWLGFNTTTIQYDHGERHSGESAYSFRSLLSHAFAGVLFQTTILLRWIVYLGFGVSLLGGLLAAYFVYRYFAYSVSPGWTSLAVLILLIGGFVISSMGIAGLYIGKIFEQVKGRPLYVVDQVLSHSKECDEPLLPEKEVPQLRA